MVKIVVASIIISAVFIVIIPLLRVSYAATLRLEPSTVITTVDKTFEVKISVNSGGEEINAIDAFVVYDANMLEVQSVSDGTFFPTVLHDFKKAGRAYVAGMVDNPGTFKVGAGTVASIFFKAKKNGSSTAVFECIQGATTDSNVVKNDLNASDIIVCSSNGSLSVTVGTSATTTTTNVVPTATSIPVPTSPPVATSIPIAIPAALPKSGVFENIAHFATPGIALVIIGFGIRLFL